jgi:hypothetical protein
VAARAGRSGVAGILGENLMTSTVSTVLEPDDLRFDHDPTRAWRSGLTTVLAAAAPILFTLSNVIMPALHGSNASVVAHIPPVADRLLATKFGYAVASLLLVFVAVALWRVSERRGAALRLAGGVLLIVGGVSNALGEVVFAYSAWGMHRAGVAPAAQAHVFSLFDNSTAALPISFLAIPVMSVGLVLLMAGVLRAAIVPWWLPVLVIVGGLAAGFVGVGVPALIGLVWSVGTAVLVVRIARTVAVRPQDA